jgi:hypothetical protein
MVFPQRGMEIVDALYRGVDPQDDDARKAAIQEVGEQMARDLGREWGNKKRAGLSDDFRSPDSIAFQEADGSTSVWDIQASSGAILVFAGKPPDYPRLPPSEATFIPCTPIDHMGDGGEVDPPQSEDLTPRVVALETEVARLREVLENVARRLSLVEGEIARPLKIQDGARTSNNFIHSHAIGGTEVVRG